MLNTVEKYKEAILSLSERNFIDLVDMWKAIILDRKRPFRLFSTHEAVRKCLIVLDDDGMAQLPDNLPKVRANEILLDLLATPKKIEAKLDLSDLDTKESIQGVIDILQEKLEEISRLRVDNLKQGTFYICEDSCKRCIVFMTNRGIHKMDILSGTMLWHEHDKTKAQERLSQSSTKLIKEIKMEDLTK